MGRSDHGTITGKISAADLAALERGELPGPNISLLVYHRDGVRSVPLLPERRLVVGRAPEAMGGLVIEDDSLSREHASFTLAGEAVIVEDLGSRNGIWSLGAQVRRAELVAGDQIRLGRVPVLVHGAQALRRAARPLRHESFRVLLEDEVQRARFFARPVSLVMVRVASADGTHVSRFHERVAAKLRSIDRMAFYSSETLEIVLPEMRAEDAAAWASGVVAAAEEAELGLAFGVAGYPDAAADVETLVEKCRDALAEVGRRAGVRAAASASGRVTPAAPDEHVVGEAFRAAFEKIRRIAKSSLPILILGETGAGKDALARRIHAESPRADRALVVVNCAAIPDSLVEGTLFGHEKGAFSGAVNRMTGLFEAAHEGTLMLDEVGDLSKAAQGALLRVLEAGVIRRIGATSEISVDVRVLAATNRDLGAMVKAGTFRADLLERLHAERAIVPPLRERRDEIPSLCESFIRRANRANRRAVTGIARDASALLRAYAWPGNVRELRNAIERAVVLCESDTITIDDLPEAVRTGTPPVTDAPEPAAPVPAALVSAAPVPAAPSPSPEELAPEPSTALGDGLREQVRTLETKLVLEALRVSDDNAGAAKLLGLPLRTFVFRMHALGIKRKPSFQSAEPPKRKKP